MQTHTPKPVTLIPFKAPPKGREEGLAKRLAKLRKTTPDAANQPQNPRALVQALSEPARPMLTDDNLRALCVQTPDHQRGKLTDREQAAYAMIMPDLCAELLAHRAVAAKLAMQATNRQIDLAEARAAIKSPAVTTGTLREACFTILRHSQTAAELCAAADIVKTLEAPVT